MKKANKKYTKKLFIALGAVATVVAPIASSVAMSTDLGTDKNIDLNRIAYLFANSDKLDYALQELDNLGNLPSEARNSNEYMSFVNGFYSQSPDLQLNYVYILKSVDNTKLNYRLKLGLLKNYFDKGLVLKLSKQPTQNLKELVVAHHTDNFKQPEQIFATAATGPETTNVPTNIYYDANGKHTDYIDESLNLVPIRGSDTTKTDYGFGNDKTEFYGSNQTVLQSGLSLFAAKTEDLLSKLGIDGLTAIGDFEKELIKNSITDAGKIAKLSSNFITSTFTGPLITAISQNGDKDFSGALQATIAATGIAALGAGLSAAIGGPIGIVAGLLANVMFDVVPTANGHTMAENMSDHGLNDGDFQGKNNTETMQRLAVEGSNQYHNGIIGEVDDSMIDFPELYISTQGEPNSKKGLSTGTSFNFGGKIAFVAK